MRCSFCFGNGKSENVQCRDGIRQAITLKFTRWRDPDLIMIQVLRDFPKFLAFAKDEKRSLVLLCKSHYLSYIDFWWSYHSESLYYGHHNTYIIINMDLTGHFSYSSFISIVYLVWANNRKLVWISIILYQIKQCTHDQKTRIYIWRGSTNGKFPE